jgi:hypothetical protein
MPTTRRNRTLSLAGLGAAAAAGSAQGAIVSSGALNLTLSANNPFDFNNDSSTDLTLSAAAGKEGLFVSADGDLVVDGTIGTSSFDAIDLLAPGTTIDASLSYASDAYFALDGSIATGGEWVPVPTTGYFGFSFLTADGTHYGYGELTVSELSSPTPTATLHAWAYESVAGQSITIPSGDVPLPGTAALFAAAGTFVLLKRLVGKRRN